MLKALVQESNLNISSDNNKSVMTPFTFLFLSDIHFGSFSDYADFCTKDSPPKHSLTNEVSIKESLLNNLSNKKINAILIPGDITSTACPIEFVECKNIIEEIAEKINVPKEMIFYTFGNHDTCWKISRLSDPLDGKINSDPLYKKVAGKIGDVFIKNPGSIEQGPIAGSGFFTNDIVNIIIANSGFASTHDQDQQRGKLGQEQFVWLKNTFDKLDSNNKWNIFMVHHHIFNYPYPVSSPDKTFIEEDADLLYLLGNSNVDLVCHGHRHHPYLLTAMYSDWTHPITFFCGGSLAVNATHRNRGEIPNLFHIISLEDRTEQGTAIGNVTTFEFKSSEGWIPSEYRKEVPFDHIQKFSDSVNERKIIDIVNDFFKKSLGKSHDRLIELPCLSDWPLEIQCLTKNRRNGIFAKQADELNCKFLEMHGSFYLLKP